MGLYPEIIADHFKRPRNNGSLKTASGRGRGENAGCGDVLQIDVLVHAGVLSAYRFQAKACSAVIACASMVGEAIQGKPIDSARELDIAQLIEAAGGLPRSKAHAPKVVERALQAALVEAAANEPS